MVSNIAVGKPALERDSRDEFDLADLIDQIGSKLIIIASNRGPIQYGVDQDRMLVPTKAGGGVAIALSSLSKYLDSTWVTGAMCDGDRRAAEQAGHQAMVASVGHERHRIRFVTLPQQTYDKHYSVFCNPFLWFFHHNVRRPVVDAETEDLISDSWANGYIPANNSFAQAVMAVADKEEAPIVMIHDYHLYLAPGIIRVGLPDAVIQHFIHIPWPAPQQWINLPCSISTSVVESLCCCDIVGLQTMRDVRNFLLTCQLGLEGADVDYRRRCIRYNGRETKVNAYPISVDVAELEKLALSEEVREYERRLLPFLGRKTIVRVDRVDPTKNITIGFEAYDMLLARHPELVGDVNFIAFLVPSRTNIKEYQDYARSVFALVDAINSRYGNVNWTPIKVFHEHNYPQALAGMRLYDVLLVNPVADGMNLVAKEGSIVNTSNGVLVLSETAGSHEQLKGHAMSISPQDVEGTEQALYRALTMPTEERRQRAQGLRERIREEDITKWLADQLRDLVGLTEYLPGFPISTR